MRFLRFRGQGPGKVADYWDMPAALHAIERGTGEADRSILGEWGASLPQGPYERLVPGDLVPAPTGPDGDDTPETATPLASGAHARGRAAADRDVDWYAVSVPDGQNSLAVEVTGRPVVGVSVVLFDAEGYPVPTLFGPGDRPGSVVYRAEVTPGASYLVRVEQPPSSIVFAFDTSGSMGAYLDDVFQGLRAFRADVMPGAEAVKIVPFEERPLLRDWSDQAYELQNAVDRYRMGAGSSSAETAILDATTDLSARQGARAILVVTDAETSSFERSAELWRNLSAVRPLIFAVHVGATSEPFLSTTYMQDWSRVAGGFYQYTRSHGEMDRAFDRLSTWLRRPVEYELALTISYEEKPPPSRAPGSIAVRSRPGAESPLSRDVGVEIILDTSGSMLSKVGRRPRIDVARDVLRDLVTTRLPAGVPTAVRTFGAPGDPCGTQLAVPLGPLDPAAMTAFVDGLEVEKETATPIGAALTRVADDLAAAPGTKVVVLVTDGQETCHGDPAATVRDLVRQGVDVRLNIVGFALKGRKARNAMRAWARSGHGSYFDARGEKDLGRSIRLAFSAPFRILDEAGNEVASGTVDGDPVSVPPGTYSLVVLADPVTRFDGVIVEPGAAVSRTLEAPAPAVSAGEAGPAGSPTPADSPAPGCP